MISMNKFPSLRAGVFLVCLFGSALATADTVTCDSTESVDVVCQGTETIVGDGLSIVRFSITRNSQYELSIVDYAWPVEPLASISSQLSTAKGLIGGLSAAGALEFFAAPGDYFIQIYAVAGMSSVGLLGYKVSDLNPVPLPSSLLLLSATLGMVLLAARRRQQAAESTAEEALLDEQAVRQE